MTPEEAIKAVRKWSAPTMHHAALNVGTCLADEVEILRCTILALFWRHLFTIRVLAFDKANKLTLHLTDLLNKSEAEVERLQKALANRDERLERLTKEIVQHEEMCRIWKENVLDAVNGEPTP